MLDGIARLMADFPTLTFRVHGETGTAANGTSVRLAQHFGLHNTRDAKRVLDGLANLNPNPTYPYPYPYP